MGALPVLRVLTHPQPGFGLDAQLPMGRHLRCLLSAEAYILGGSEVRFGVELVRVPFLRLQLAPSAQLSLRLPLLRLTEFKTVYGGAALTLHDRGAVPRLRLRRGTDWAALWKGLQGFVKPVAELRHRVTVLGTLLDNEQRRVVREAALELQQKREERMRERRQDRKRLLNGSRLPEVPGLDPRLRPDTMEALRKQMMEKYGTDGVTRKQRADPRDLQMIGGMGRLRARLREVKEKREAERRAREAGSGNEGKSEEDEAAGARHGGGDERGTVRGMEERGVDVGIRRKDGQSGAVASEEAGFCAPPRRRRWGLL